MPKKKKTAGKGKKNKAVKKKKTAGKKTTAKKPVKREDKTKTFSQTIMDLLGDFKRK